MDAAGTLRFAARAPNRAGILERLYVAADAADQSPVARLDGELPAPILAPGARRTLRVIHFNDLHNNLTIPDRVRGDSRLLAQIVARANAARREAAADEIVMLASGGDDHTGNVLDELLGWTPGEFVLDPAYAAYSAAGLDVAAIGNHELDRGAALLAAAIRQDAAFPLLSANLVGSRHLRSPRDYVAAAIGVARGLRIGMLGLITPVDTRVHPPDDPGLAVESPLAALRRLLPALAAASDVVLVMSHCGYGADTAIGGKASVVRQLAEGDLVIAREAARLSPRPVAIIGAHTHTVLNLDGLGPATLVDGVPIVQAGGNGSHVGELELRLEIGAARPIATAARLHALGRHGAGDERSDAAFERRVMAPMIARLRDRLDEIVASADDRPELSTEATLAARYTGECAIANFIADGLVARSAAFAQGRVDLAIVNATAIGTGVVPGRPVSFRDWYGVIPYADAIQVATMTAGELAAVLDSNAKRLVRPDELAGAAPIDLRGHVSRGFLHFSAALRYAIALGPDAARACALEPRLHGAVLLADPERVIRVAFTNYVGAGGYGEAWNGAPIGGGVPGAIASVDLRPLPKADTGLILRNEILGHLRAVGVIGEATGAALDGRLAVIR